MVASVGGVLVVEGERGEEEEKSLCQTRKGEALFVVVGFRAGFRAGEGLRKGLRDDLGWNRGMRFVVMKTRSKFRAEASNRALRL